MLFTLSVVFSFIIAVYFYLTWHLEYWKTRGVLSPKPNILFGNLSKSTRRKCHLTDDLTRIYNDYKHRGNFVGIYQMRSPRLVVLEPALAKNILITDFKNFHDNEFSEMFQSENDPLFSRNPFLSRGEEWKARRSEISPAFSANRTKALYPLIEDVCQRFTDYIKENLRQPFDANELSSKFTTEAVASCIFGIKADCLNNEKSKLREMSRQLFKPSAVTIMKVLLTSVIPSLKQIMKIQFINKFFIDLINESIEYRTKHQISREDFLDYLITLQKKKNLSSTDLAGHSITFFSDGLETSSVTIAYTLYELARNTHVQEKLRKEITDKQGKMSVDDLNNFSYLDQVLHECLRMHPPFPWISQQCTEETELDYQKGKKVRIQKGINIYIPLYQIQRDPEYYPNPTVFMPERFDAEGGGVKHFKDRGVFLTFGAGPRQCLGISFTMLEAKAAVVEVIRNFKITVNNKTDSELVLDPNEFINIKRGGIWLDFKPIKMFQL